MSRRLRPINLHPADVRLELLAAQHAISDATRAVMAAAETDQSIGERVRHRTEALNCAESAFRRIRELVVAIPILETPQ